jgi:hypothetical protein
VRIEQVRTREPEGNLSGAIPSAKGPTMEAQLEALVDRLDDLVGYTPDGEKRNALADAHNSLVEAIDHLKKAKSL